MKRDRWLQEIIEKKRSDPVSSLARLFLFVLSIVYRFVIQVRNWAYNQGFFRSNSVAAPVVCVGNLTVGGTGKTPMVIWLADFLSANYRVTVLSRGYKAQTGRLNDEGLEISRRLPGVHLIQNPNRVAAAREVSSQPSQSGSKPAVIILDDGFQHRRLARDLDVVLIDATQPFGTEFLLPRGYLREPVSSIKRADVVVLSRSNLVDKKIRSEIKASVVNLNPDIVWAETKLVASHWRTADQQKVPLDALQQQRIFAFCGVGNPDGFLRTLEHEKLNIVDSKFFPDHHSYTQADLKQIFEAANENNCECVVCTQKDLVKIDAKSSMPVPVFSLIAKLAFMNGEQPIIELIRDKLAKLKNTR